MNVEKPPDDEKKNFFKCVKFPLGKLLNDNPTNIITCSIKISQVAEKCDKIVTNALMFMKLYLLNHFEKFNSLPEIDSNFVLSCLIIQCTKATKGRPPNQETQDLRNKLTEFYDSDFLPLLSSEKTDYDNLTQVLKYLATDIVTMYENNIKQHYVEYVQSYINFIWKKKETINKIREDHKEDSKKLVQAFCRELSKLKKDILSNDSKYKSSEKYHSWINEVKKSITPNKEKYEQDSLYYDLQCDPQKYLPCMIRIMKEIENGGQKIYNIFPMRTSVTRHSVTLDTFSLVKLLEPDRTKTTYYSEHISECADEIWGKFFSIEKRYFRKKGYSFHHMIHTDGVSCSIHFIREDLKGKKKVKSKKKKSEDKYIDELDEDTYERLKEKKLVSYDPGMDDLIYCVDSANKDAKEFRYSQNSRRKECKLKKFSKIRQELSKNKIIDGKKVKNYENELSKFDRKTLCIDKFKEYIRRKSYVNKKLFNFYGSYLFSKLKLDTYINTMRNEQKMINNFKNLYGDPSEVVIVSGDWEQKKNMKFKEPTKGLGIRRLFRKNGYEIYLADEFRTSCKCSKCESEDGDCEKFLTRPNPRPWRNDQNILVHGALRCKICGAVWNRDVNGSTNIYKIAWNAIHGIERPKYLQRGKEDADI
jgi:hypothetical protein